MTKMTYAEQLKHPNWQRKRLEMLESCDWECVNCGARDAMLHVHHKQYIKGRMAWDYSYEELAVLCESCHKNEHELRDAINQMLVALPTYEVAPLLAGFSLGYEEVGIEAIKAANKNGGLPFLAGALACIVSGLSASQIIDVMTYSMKYHSKSSIASSIYSGVVDVVKKGLAGA